jgi:hypothetical protein
MDGCVHERGSRQLADAVKCPGRIEGEPWLRVLSQDGAGEIAHTTTPIVRDPISMPTACAAPASSPTGTGGRPKVTAERSLALY